MKKCHGQELTEANCITRLSRAKKLLSKFPKGAVVFMFFTDEYLRQATPEFISPDLWLPNRPDLNPVDYKIWAVFRNACTRSLYVKQRLVKVYGLTCSRQSSMQPLVNGERDSGPASMRRGIILNIGFNIFKLSVVC